MFGFGKPREPQPIFEKKHEVKGHNDYVNAEEKQQREKDAIHNAYRAEAKDAKLDDFAAMNQELDQADPVREQAFSAIWKTRALYEQKIQNMNREGKRLLNILKKLLNRFEDQTQEFRQKISELNEVEAALKSGNKQPNDVLMILEKNHKEIQLEDPDIRASMKGPAASPAEIQLRNRVASQETAATDRLTNNLFRRSDESQLENKVDKVFSELSKENPPLKLMPNTETSGEEAQREVKEILRTSFYSKREQYPILKRLMIQPDAFFIYLSLDQSQVIITSQKTRGEIPVKELTNLIDPKMIQALPFEQTSFEAAA